MLRDFVKRQILPSSGAVAGQLRPRGGYAIQVHMFENSGFGIANNNLVLR